ncbi:hypothetical protein FS827_15100 [Agrobacterium vitis]|uniref:hypothetical protein n=1 Tax=Allorhizobium ampelinum TaxID=3025782 RepID=UPI001F1F7B19|nr:hypothetical protein [Allorhizobium ampelinum]MCF1462638.1 hypothetical protein [Allorhizobium ampelinum]
MKWIEENTKKIRSLVSAGGRENLTYAALEARLAIESVCYDRLRIAHDYISNDDLKGWQPARVVQSLIADVDEHITSGYTLSIGKTPTSDKPHDSAEDFEDYEYIPVGVQVGFDAKLLGRLWNALGNFLHVRLPVSKGDSVQQYADEKTIIAKIEEVLSELDKLATGTMIGSGFGQGTTSFICECGTTNRRRSASLRAGKKIGCINANCKERWIVHVKDDDIWFHRETIRINCFACGEPHPFAAHELMRMEADHEWTFNCRKCGELSRVRWRLCYATLPSWQPKSTDAQATP